MNIWKILGSCYFGFLVFIILNLVFGQGGMLDIRDITILESELKENIEELKKINAELTREFNDLSISPAALKNYAHTYGYYAENEYVVKIKDYENVPKAYTLGSVIEINKAPSGPNPFFHVAGISATILSFLLISAYDKRKKGE